MSERIVITIFGDKVLPMIEHQTRDIGGRGYDTIRTTSAPSRLQESLREIVREADRAASMKARDDERARLEKRLAEIYALDAKEGRDQVPGMLEAICHACGLGTDCLKPQCPNKGKTRMFGFVKPAEPT